ncbi:MAG: FtsQ-type POTRA domain-containing protein [Minisyncoccia bacterium]
MKRFSTIIDDVREQFGVWFGRALIVLVLLFIFFIAGGGVSHKSKWRILHVNVIGASAVPADEVRALVMDKILGNYFLVYARNNSYLFPIGEINQALLSTFPRIASVSVERVDEHTITINISERKPYALWCGLPATAYRSNEADTRWQAGGKQIVKDCWFIDETGFIFDKAPEFSKGVYMEIYGKLVEKIPGEPLRASVPFDRFVTANAFAKLLNDKVGKPYLISLKPEGELEVTIFTSSKYPFLADTTIRIKDESTPETLLKNLLSAIPVQFPNNVIPIKKLQYIDMRFGNKVIFGFENS